jgi:hypothetical protein
LGQGTSGSGGTGGNDGNQGGTNTPSQAYGGGGNGGGRYQFYGCCSYSDNRQYGGPGYSGFVRIIWAGANYPSRSFPSNNTGNL